MAVKGMKEQEAKVANEGSSGRKTQKVRKTEQRRENRNRIEEEGVEVHLWSSHVLGILVSTQASKLSSAEPIQKLDG